MRFAGTLVGMVMFFGWIYGFLTHLFSSQNQLYNNKFGMWLNIDFYLMISRMGEFFCLIVPGIQVRVLEPVCTSELTSP